MKTTIAVLAVSGAFAFAASAQSPSPAATTPSAATSTTTTAAAPATRSDIYHVHFEKAALGKAVDAAEAAMKQAPDAPMPGHYIVLRHQDGDDWDYCVIEHLGTKTSLEASRPAPPPSQTGLTDWHTDTFVTGPAWATFAKEMGLDDATKTNTSAYVTAVYRPAAGQREALDKFLNEPPDRATDTSSGNVVLQHMEGAAWTFMAISRYNSWADFAKNEVNSIGQMSKKDAGWFKLRNLISYHSDTLCDRLVP